MAPQLQDDVALVTGAGSGLGKASALLLAEAGAQVAAFDLNQEAARATREEISRSGGTAIAIAGDSSVEEDVGEAVHETAAQLGKLTILVNAAGIVVRKGLLETSGEEWRRVVDVNLNGYFYFLKASVPQMQAGGGGRIVQIASIAGHIGYGYPSYTAAKGGVLAVTKQLAGELAPHRIRINSISPGVIQSGFNVDTLSQQPIREATIANTPWGRLGQPDDIAKAVRFLVSPESDFITGADLVVDGGMISLIHWGTAQQSLQSFHAEPTR